MGCSSSNRIKATDVSVQTGHPFLWLVVARPVFVICYFYCTHDNNAAGCTTLSCTGLRTGLAWPVLAASAASQGPTQWKRLYSQLRQSGWLAGGKCNSFEWQPGTEWGNFFHYEWCGGCAFYPFIIYEFRVQTCFASKQVAARELEAPARPL